MFPLLAGFGEYRYYYICANGSPASDSLWEDDENIWTINMMSIIQTPSVAGKTFNSIYRLMVQKNAREMMITVAVIYISEL